MTGEPQVRLTGFSVVARRLHEKYLTTPCGDACDGLNHWLLESPSGEAAGRVEFFMLPQKDADRAHAAGVAR